MVFQQRVQQNNQEIRKPKGSPKLIKHKQITWNCTKTQAGITKENAAKEPKNKPMSWKTGKEETRL